MAKVVQLSEKAYARLTAEKKGGESYSDVVLRFLEKRDPRRIVGKLRIRKDIELLMDRMRRADRARSNSVWK